MGSLHERISGAILKAIRARRTASSAQEIGSQVEVSRVVAPAKLREARFSDFDAVSRLKQRWGLAADSLENWERLWRRNPALKRGGIERPMGWVLDADGAVVGYLGNISLQCRLGERTLSAVAAHGLVADAPYRAVSLTLAAAFFRQESVDLYISTTAIEAVGRISLAFKCDPLPQPDYGSVLFWVLQPYPFAQALTTTLNLSPTLAKIGSTLVALAVRTDKALGRRCPKPSPTPFTVSEVSVEDLGEDFQSLWSEKLKESPRLFGDRDLAALRWHFEIPGDRGCARALCCYKDGELVGYAVVRTDTDPGNGLRKSVMADTLVRRDDPEIVRALWAAAYESAKREGSHVLEVLGYPPGIRQACAEWNPYVRQYPACPYYYKAADPILHKALSDGAAWYATPFDGDATLIRPSYSSSSSVRDGVPGVQMEDHKEKIVSHNPVEERTEVF